MYPSSPSERLGYAARLLALAVWAFLVWGLLTWTATLEFFLVGAALAVVTAVALAPFGPVVTPWRLLAPRRLAGLVLILVKAAGRVVLANLDMARRVWSPLPPQRPGVVLVTTSMRTEGEVAAMGVITSLIVDNQIVDVDRARHQVLYHCVEVPEGADEERRAAINEPVEADIRRLRGT
ncbi:MAG TPA: Na+/H+ antiporter subunit E [Nocardioidaceae bacterium]|nr:Na+/H+ antiporter subunit E [Nocardioidaceae bacterium]